MDASVLRKALEKSAADFTILKWMERKQIQAALKDGILKSFTQTISQGVGCRSLVEGSWGFSSTTDVKEAPEVVKTSERLARLSCREEFIEIAEADPVTGKWSPQIETPATIADMDQLFELVREADRAVKAIPNVVSDSVSILIVTDEKILLTSEGTHIYQKEPRIMGTITILVKKSGKISYGKEIIGGESGIESFEKGYFSKIAVDLAHKASRRIDTTLPPAGKVPVVLSGEVVGMLVHETVGHASEADIVRTESFLSRKIGSLIAAPLISIVDDATFPGGFGTIGFDDEGVPAQSTPIIAEGILTSYLHSRETAHWFNVRSTGNARAWLFSREPAVRMSNTFLLPQDMSFEELLEIAKTGLYLSGGRGGSADRNGQFTFTTTDAQKIVKGELIDEYFVGPVIAGDALDALNVCTGVGNRETFVLHASVCGKEESAFVASGGPALVTELHVGGVL